MIQINKEDIKAAKDLLSTQFEGINYDKVLCILNILILEEIKGLRARMDDLQSAVGKKTGRVCYGLGDLP